MMADGATMEHNARPLWGGGRQPFGASYGKLMMWFFLLSDALTFSGFLAAMGLVRFKYEDTWPIAEEVFTHFPFVEGDAPLLYVALMTFILILSSVTMVMAVDAGHKMNKKGVMLWMGLTIIGGFFFLASQAWEWGHFINGDKGAIQIEDRTVVYISDMEGKVVPLRTLIDGPDAHGHGTEYTDEQMFNAFKANDQYTLRRPGKNGEIFERGEALKLAEKAGVVQGANLVQNEYGNVLFADFFFFITGFHGFHVFSGVVINIIIFINVVMGTYEKRGHYEMVEKVGLYWHFVDLVWVFVFTFFYLV
ncbi:cytochrome c oxidase subunit 3 [Owenweeksia hongkongensis]|uniref:Heme/copper-type cytochrome/quinol oxidase, subunit 3 n=1 Tax=Owenweeksia hongkongensis (strain DSM 17368 / CIP 108786 / JCM 12287 / NRRL B-23963 / UST20020801) TaxID=926562 RepID=G8R294_OWEHD|nr:heme/copper-type cytochrome/quinol oxidase, subunit 3 [Owenweeksia hongkongensis DSM 17368]